MQNKRAMVFVNGEISDYTSIGGMIRPGDFLLAVDGGVGHLHRLGLEPDVLLGDLDSVEPQVVRLLEEKGKRIQRFPVDKNETDLELALEYVLERGFSTIRLFGTFGGRLDQTLGNIFLLTGPRFSSKDIRCLDGGQEAFIIRSRTQIYGNPGDTVSLLPLSAESHGVVTVGMKYPLNNETLYFEKTRGISNRLLGNEGQVSITSGILLCIHTSVERS